MNSSKLEYVYGLIDNTAPYNTFNMSKTYSEVPMMISAQIQLSGNVWTDLNKISEITAIRNNANQIRIEKISADTYANYQVRFLLFDIS